MVGLGARRIDLAAHFLGDETDLAAGHRLGVEGFAEVLAVLAQPHLLLVDVELFDIVDHLLLQSLGVGLGAQFSQSGENPLADRIDPLTLILLYFSDIRFDLVHLREHVAPQALPFAGPEGLERRHGLVDAALQDGPVGLRELRLLGFGQHVGQFKQPGQQGLVGEADAHRIQRLAHAGIVALKQVAVHRPDRFRSGIAPQRNEEIDTAAAQFGGQVAADFRLLAARDEGGFQGDVGILAVDRSQFDRVFVPANQALRLSVAGH